MQNRLLELIVGFTRSRGTAILIGFAVATLLGAGLLTRLEISTSQKALIPTDHPVQAEFLAFVEEFGAVDNLIVVLEGEPETIRSSADFFAAALRAETAWVKQVFYRVDLDFFAERALLFVPTAELRRGEEVLVNQASLIERVAEVRNLAAILAAMDRGFGEPAVEFHPDAVTGILRGVEEMMREWRRWLEDPTYHAEDLVSRLFATGHPNAALVKADGYLISRDGRMLFLLVQPISSSDEAAFLRPFHAAMRAAVERVFADYPSLRGQVHVGFTGLPAHVLTEIETVFDDVTSGASVAVILVVLILFVGFRTPRKVAIAVIPLVAGMVISLGVVTLVLGRLNLISAAFMAVMFGMSIDFGIYLVRRTEEEMGGGASLAEAVRVAVTRTGRGVLTGGLTTACAFFGIGLSDFTGFAELGITAGIGTLVCLTAVFLLVPVLLLRFGAEPKLPALTVARDLARAPSVVQLRVALVLVVALLAIWAVHRGRGIAFDYNALHLLPRDTESTTYQLRMEAESDYAVSAAMVLADSLEEIRSITTRLRTLPEVLRVESLADLVPADQAEKLAIIRRCRAPLSKVEIAYQPGDATVTDYQAGLARLSQRFADAEEAAFNAGRVELVERLGKVQDEIGSLELALGNAPAALALQRTAGFERSIFTTARSVVELAHRWLEARPVTEEQLPSELRARMRSSQGHYLAYVFPKGSVWDVDFLDRFVAQLKEVTPRITGFPVTHQVYSRLVVDGFIQAMLYSLLAVILLLAFDFRRADAVILALLPLVIAVALLQLVIAYGGKSYNFANIAAFPVLLGYGVAYGVNIVNRWRERPTETAWVSALTIGKGVVLSAATTLAGIGSITVARHNGVSTFGGFLLAGVILCLISAVFILPAVIDLLYLSADDAQEKKP